MNILNIMVANKIATYRKLDGAIVCGNTGYQLKFTFDEEWAEYNEKTARFIWNGHFEERDFTGDTCDVPIIRNAEAVEVGVYAGNLKTTTSATLPALRSILCGGEPPTEEDAQFTSAAKEAAERAKASEDAAKGSATNAAASANEARGYMEVAQGVAADSVNLDARITKNDKRITNLEQGLPDDNFMVDETVAYTKDVPTNALPYAEIAKIGGMTYKDGDTLRSAKVSEVVSFEQHTLPIPAAVQALDGYGDGVNDTVYNYIDWEKKQFVKRVGKVDMGTQSYAADIPNNYAYITALAKKDYSQILCSHYPEHITNITTNRFGDIIVSFEAGAFTSAGQVKAAMSGVMLVYELAEPIVTDILDLITADNMLSVEGNGSLTFVNEYGYAVPSTIEYQLEV